MLLVVDANRVISALLSKGEVPIIFLVNKFLKKFEFVSPEYLFFELGRNIDEIVEKSKLSPNELAIVFRYLKEEISFIPFEQFNRFSKEAELITPHSKDVSYFALALALNCPIWSEEKAFKKQSKVKILSTSEVWKILFSKS